MLRSLVLAVAWILALDLGAMQVSLSPIKQPRCGLFDGSIGTWVYNGGVPPYSYLWSTGDTTSSIDSLPPGTYSVIVTDATNATATNSTTLQNIQALYFPTSTLYLQDCFGGGCEASLTWPLENFQGTPPYSYSPQPTGSTPEDVTWALCFLGQYNQVIPITVTDANGCAASLNGVWFLQIGVGLDNSIGTLPSCNGGANGTAFLHVSFTDIQSTNSITVLNAGNQVVYSTGNFGDFMSYSFTVTGLLPGVYHTSVTSAVQSCTTMTYPGPSFTIQDMGVDCGTVTGDIYVDADNDCVQDGGEAVERYALLSIQPGDEITFTDANGHYVHNLQYGSYTIEHSNPNYVQQCPAVSPIPFVLDGDPQTVNIDIADSSLYGHDVAVHMSSSAARPGFVQHVWIDMANQSLYPSGDLSLTFDFDPTVQFISSTLTPDQIGSGSLQWDLGVLPVYGHQQIHLQLQVPPDVGLIGYELLSTATLSNTLAESSTANNVFTNAVTITGSLDPNDKLVRTSSGTSPFQFFSDLDEYVEYTIRFQNSGTDTAFTVVIRDTISEVFDLLTTEIIGSSHPMSADVRNPRVLTFTFDDILLPDSNTNEPASHGFVTFRIRPVEGLLPGASLANDADIYFDFNPPVITNNTELFVELSTSVQEQVQGLVQVHPNPATDAARIVVDDRQHRIFQLDVVAADGRVLLRDVAFQNGAWVDLRQLPAGAYVARLVDADGGVHQVHFIKH